MKRRISGVLISLLVGGLLGSPAQAGPLVDLSAEASRPAPNDLLRATLYVEMTGSDPAALARKVNGELAEAQKLIKARAGVSVKTGRHDSYPVYGGQQKFEGWRMRAELVLESRDLATFSTLLGELQQQRLMLGNLVQQPAPETRRQVEDETAKDAIQAFRQRAEVIAQAMGKSYQIKQMSVHQNGAMVPPVRMMRASADRLPAAAPVPLETGDTRLTTVVSGQIELTD